MTMRASLCTSGLLAAFLAVAPVTTTVAGEIHEVHIVHQTTNFSAAKAVHMFQFKPNILRLEPGETVEFLNSLGSHTVLTQDGLWPDGVEPVNIRGKTRTKVVFDTPGLYGITCGRHGRYGMSMLIAVGAEGVEQAATVDTGTLPTSKIARQEFDRLLSEIASGGG